jgi:hypothetical protein
LAGAAAAAAAAAAAVVFSCTSHLLLRMMSGNEQLLTACRSVHAYATFCAPVPLQLGIAAAFEHEIRLAHSISTDRDTEQADDDCGSHLLYSSKLLAANARALSRALIEQRLQVCPAAGGYFIVADVSPTQLCDVDFCRCSAFISAPFQTQLSATVFEQHNRQVSFPSC